jgi:hypothetical protein
MKRFENIEAVKTKLKYHERMTSEIHRLICSYNIAGNNDIDASNDNDIYYSEQIPIEAEVLRESESFQKFVGYRIYTRYDFSRCSIDSTVRGNER